MSKLHVDTRLAHAGERFDLGTGAVMPPISLASTYRREKVDAPGPYTYARIDNPNRAALEAAIADLEGAPDAVAFASGCAAMDAALQLAPHGGGVLACRELYGGTYRLLTSLHQERGITLHWFSLADPASLQAGLDQKPALLWLESPSNPLLRLIDLPKTAALARAAGVRTVIDNTFATPLLQRPLDLGIDIVVHSSTKYFGGHSDTLGGVALSRDPHILERLRFIQRAKGGALAPFDAYLTLRGLRTLHLRLATACRNARAVAAFLAQQTDLAAVHYPGLPAHPDHALAQRQMADFGAIVSADLGTAARAKTFLETLDLFALGDSLGGVESLCSYASAMSHAALSASDLVAAGITPGLVRLSVGIESAADLVDDIAKALNLARQTR